MLEEILSATLKKVYIHYLYQCPRPASSAYFHNRIYIRFLLTSPILRKRQNCILHIPLLEQL